MKKSTYLILLISLFFFIFSTYHLSIWFYDGVKAVSISKKIERSTNPTLIKSQDNDFVNPPANPNDATYLYKDTPFLEINFSELLNINPDTIAYILVPGTNIDYPVVKAGDNEYYLSHAFDKSASKSGAIFLDYRNNFINLSTNTIIYGHGRKDGTMFGSLNNILTNDWYQDYQNHIIKISTPQENYLFQIFSVYSIEKENYYLTTYFKNKEDILPFINTLKNRSIFDFPTEVNIYDKILTLSTCYDASGMRTVIHAKLIKKRSR